MENQKKDNNIVEMEVNNLFKKNNVLSHKDIEYLKNKYNNDTEIVEKIQKMFLEKYNKINKKAKKFAFLIKTKYDTSLYPYHVLLDKARKFKEKYNLSNEEYAEFLRIFEKEMAGKSTDLIMPDNQIKKIFGSINIDITPSSVIKQKLNPEDFKILQDVFKLKGSSEMLHSQVILQSVQYQDLDNILISENLNRSSNQNPSHHIHPVLVAMFAPRINLFEQVFLHSNLSRIIEQRRKEESFTTHADLVLFDRLTKDPSYIECDQSSIILDLYNRCKVQQHLWHNVLHLRNGYYFDASFTEIIPLLNLCKLNKYDTPDSIYGRFDNVIIRRLFNIFVLRPTIVTTLPIIGLDGMNPYAHKMIPQISRISMINLRIPAKLISDDEEYNLEDLLKNQHLVYENNVLVRRQTNIVSSEDVLVFSIDRRANLIKYSTARGINMPELPLAISGLERLNKTPVLFNLNLSLRNDNYNLRSVILAEETELHTKEVVVIGSSAVLINPKDESKNIYSPELFIYNPQKLNKINSNNNINIHPISSLNNPEGEAEIMDLCQQNGLIFIYQIEKGLSATEVIIEY